MIGGRRLYERYLSSFLWLYAFLSGFVFFEPSLAEYAFILALPGLLALMHWDRRTGIFSALLFAPMAASALYALFAFGNVQLRFLAIDSYVFLLFIVGRGLFDQAVDDRNRLLSRIFAAMFIASSVGIIVGAIVYATGINPTGMRIIFKMRLYGFFKDTNVFASYMLLPFFYYAQRFFDAASFRKALPSAAASVILSLGILLTFSRAAWLAYGFGLLALLLRALFSARREIKLRALLFAAAFSIVLAVLVSGVVKVGSFDIGSIIKSRLGFLGYDAKRFTAQAKSWDMFEQSPVLGVGPGNYELYSRVSAHSLYHRILGERGLIGSLSFLAFAAVTVFIARKKKIEAFLLVAILALLLESFFIDTLHWRHFWLILLLALGAPDPPAKEKPEGS